MKKVLFMILMLAPIAAMAQKFGHVNSQEVIQAMPEYTKAKTEIEALAQQYEADLKSMQEEMTKLQAENKRLEERIAILQHTQQLHDQTSGNDKTKATAGMEKK